MNGLRSFMKGVNNFDVEVTFARFKEVKQVKIGNVVYDVKVDDEKQTVYFCVEGGHPIDLKTKALLYERWLTIDGVLHYIQRVNGWMGGAAKMNYIKAEI